MYCGSAAIPPSPPFGSLSSDHHRRSPRPLACSKVSDHIAPAYRGARGLGWNMAQALAEAGADAVALLDVKRDLGDAAAAELRSTAGIPVRFYNVDVRDETAVAGAVARIAADLGAVDVVINSAGVVE